jgi:hypothetical protein
VALHNLCYWLLQIHRYDEAVAPAQEAVAIRRNLPELTAADLAASLENRHLILGNAGRYAEAVVAARRRWRCGAGCRATSRGR